MSAPEAGGAHAAEANSALAGTYAASGASVSASGASVSASDASVGELIGQVTRDFSTLMRQEVDLAKAEIKAEVTKAGKGAGMLGGSGFAGYMVVLFLSFALWWGLANVMDQGWAALIVAAVWAVIAAVLYARGRSELRSVNPKPQRTVETVSQVPSALKGQ